MECRCAVSQSEETAICSARAWSTTRPVPCRSTTSGRSRRSGCRIPVPAFTPPPSDSNSCGSVEIRIFPLNASGTSPRQHSVEAPRIPMDFACGAELPEFPATHCDPFPAPDQGLFRSLFPRAFPSWPNTSLLDANNRRKPYSQGDGRSQTSRQLKRRRLI